MQEAALLTFPGGQDAVTDAAWSPSNASVFAATTAGGMVQVWDISSSVVQPLCRMGDLGAGERMTCLAFAKVGGCLRPLECGDGLGLLLVRSANGLVDAALETMLVGGLCAEEAANLH